MALSLGDVMLGDEGTVRLYGYMRICSKMYVLNLHYRCLKTRMTLRMAWIIEGLLH